MHRVVLSQPMKRLPANYVGDCSARDARHCVLRFLSSSRKQPSAATPITATFIILELGFRTTKRVPGACPIPGCTMQNNVSFGEMPDQAGSK